MLSVLLSFCLFLGLVVICIQFKPHFLLALAICSVLLLCCLCLLLLLFVFQVSYVLGCLLRGACTGCLATVGSSL